jgi:hypothetical protein
VIILGEQPIKKIEGHEEYSITNNGRVFSHKWGKFKEVKPQLTEKGYHKVWLYKDKKRSMHFVHRLVLKTFGEPVEGKYVVNHKDGNPLNNFIENLEWVTPKENDTHAREQLDKGKPYRATPEKVREILFLKEQGLSTRKVAGIVGISKSTVGKVFKEADSK